MGYNKNVPVFTPAELEVFSSSLRESIEGKNETEIIDTLTALRFAQRQQVKELYWRDYGRDLIDDLRNGLGSKYEDVVAGLMLPAVEYLCKQLYKAMPGIGNNDRTLVEILIAKTNEELAEIVTTYENMYNRSLVDHMCGEKSSHVRRLLALIVTGVRDPFDIINPVKAQEQAEALYAAGKVILGTDEEVFNQIFAHSSFAQLRLVFDLYDQISGQTIEMAILNEMSVELRKAMIAIVRCIRSPITFTPRLLYIALDGTCTDYYTLIFNIICRAEIDLVNIKMEFENIYGIPLMTLVMFEAPSEYKRVLCNLIGLV